MTDTADHICYFRHALALDERRVKFLPEYVHGGTFYGGQHVKNQHKESRTARPAVFDGATGEAAELGVKQNNSSLPPHIKEVWFPGTHSDM